MIKGRGDNNCNNMQMLNNGNKESSIEINVNKCDNSNDDIILLFGRNLNNLKNELNDPF